MGIKGLWKELQSVCTVSHISQFKGQKVAVDGYCWLHRAAMASVIPLSTGQPCDKFIQFFMARVELLQRFGVIPVLVFDGHSMPMKAATDRGRAERRDAARREGLVLLANGRREEASSALEKGISITTEIAHACITVAKRKGVEVVVAPYEADAQLAYLCKEGHVQAVVTEDSDLIVYGCGVVIAKLDGQGNCDVLRSRDLPQVSSLAGLSYQSFVWVCIMSGCDYLPSLAGVGIKTATKIVGGGSSGGGGAKSIAQIMQHFAQQGFPARELQAYEDCFHKAFYCFAHHLVFDPVLKAILPFTPLPPSAPELRGDIVGELMTDAELAVGMCGTATVDPRTRQPYTGKHQDSVKMYLRRHGGTQKTLAEAGMHIKMEPIDNKPRYGPTVAGLNPVRYAQQGVRSVDANTGWRKKSAADSGGLCVDEQEPTSVHYVRSKYFPVSNDGSTDELTEILPNEEEGGAFVTSPLSAGSEQPSSTSPTMLAVLRDEPMLGGMDSSDDEADDIPVQQQHMSSARSQNLTTSSPHGVNPVASRTVEQLRDVQCPHGYVECGKAHSILVRCFADHPEWRQADEVPSGGSGGTSQNTPPITTPPMMVVARPSSMVSPPLGRARQVRPPQQGASGTMMNLSSSATAVSNHSRQKRERDVATAPQDDTKTSDSVSLVTLLDQKQAVASRPTVAHGTSGLSENEDDELFPLNAKHQQRLASATSVAEKGKTNFALLAFSAKQKEAVDNPQPSDSQTVGPVPPTPPGTRVMASSANNPFAAFAVKKRQA